MKHLLWTALFLAVFGAGATPAWADRITDLCRYLDRGSDPRVMMRAVVALGELSSSRAMESLTRALERSSPMVRLLAARSLGKVGTAEALNVLQQRLKLEKDEPVKAQLGLSIDATRRALAGPPPGARYRVKLGALHNASGRGEPELPIVLGEVVSRGLSKVPGWWVQPADYEQAGASAVNGPRPLEIRATVLGLERRRRGTSMELACRLLVSVHNPGGSGLLAPLRVNTSINTPAADYRDVHDNAFYTDLIELAGRLAVRRVVTAVIGLNPADRQSPNRIRP